MEEEVVNVEKITSCTYFFTLGGALVLRSHEVNDTLVYLDARVDSARFEQLGEGGAAASLLVEGFVEENDAGDVVIESRVGGEKKLKIAQMTIRSRTPFYS